MPHCNLGAGSQGRAWSGAFGIILPERLNYFLLVGLPGRQRSFMVVMPQRGCPSEVEDSV